MYKCESLQPVWRHETHHLLVELYGNQPRYNDNQVAEQTVRNHLLSANPHLERTVYVRTARDATSIGYKHISSIDHRQHVSSDGVILPRNHAAFLQTADCPTVILHSPLTDKIVVVHAGRPACTPSNDGTNIITTALAQVGVDRCTTAVITGGISGKRFLHNANDSGRSLAQPFLEHFGTTAFADLETLAIDLVSLISWQLRHAGIMDHNIHHDTLCTYTHPSLASYRRDRDYTIANSVAVIRK